MTLRVAVGDPRLVSATFPAAATGPVTVTVLSSLTGATTGPFNATQVGATGTYTHQMTAVDVAEIDLLKVTFTATIGGIERSIRDHVQVCGGYYFTLEDARGFDGIDSSYSDDDIEKARHAVEDQIESNLDTSMVGRYVSERLSGSTEPFIRLSEPYIIRVISVIEDDTDVTNDIDIDGRFLWRNTQGAPWGSGHRNISIHYESGYQEFPPSDLSHAALSATRHQLYRDTHTGAPQAITSITTDMGAMRLAVAGLRQPFGVPEIDAVVLRWAKAVGTVM